MNYVLMLVLLPVITHAMDLESIRKYSTEQSQAVVIKERLSVQDQKNVYSQWLTLSVLPFLQSKEQKNCALMKQHLDNVGKVLDICFSNNIFLPINPFFMSDSQGQYIVELLDDAAIHSEVCLNACLKHMSKLEPPAKLAQKLLTMKQQAVQRSLASNEADLSLKNIDSVTSFLLVAMNKLPQADTSGYGDSF